jgi:undecaprenyl diphosphate synthase
VTNKLTEIIVPVHLAVIMDGNGRWARARKLPRTAGHREGLQTARRIVEACGEIGIRFLTLYTFSTENWKRPPVEVAFLMRLAEEFTLRELPELQRNGVRLQQMGRREGLPPSLLRALDKVSRQTQDNTNLTLNLALNYGGRAEIADAYRAIIADHQRSELDVNKLDPNTFARYLYCPDTPDADLVIRTGGEWRLSNFLLWRAAEAVFWSTPVLWPDFQREHLLEALEVYDEQIDNKEIEYVSQT